MIHEALHARATTHSGLSALISTRFYAMQLPQGAAIPALVAQEISAPQATEQGGLWRPRWQMTCYGATYAQARSVALACRDAFEGWGFDDGTDVVRHMHQVNRIDMPYDEVNRRYRVLVDFMMLSNS